MSFEINDETMREGAQSASMALLDLRQKARALEQLATLGVEAASLGMPAATMRQAEEFLALSKLVDEAGWSIDAHCAARTVVQDLEPIADTVQALGRRVTVYAFLGTSPARRFCERWELDDLVRALDATLGFAASHGLEIAFVTEDTTRSRPEDLRTLFTHALGLGVRRLVLCDTVGAATPAGAQRLVRFARELALRTVPEPVAIDWHGHDDRGLAVANTLAAVAAGADRVHGTILGAGERCGNARLDRLLESRASLEREARFALAAYTTVVREALIDLEQRVRPGPRAIRSMRRPGRDPSTLERSAPTRNRRPPLGPSLSATAETG